MFTYIINVIFSYITDISKNIIYVFSSLCNDNKEDLYSLESNNINNNQYRNSINNNPYRNSISCPNNLYSNDKYKIKATKPLTIILDLRCEHCKRLIMKDKSIYCFNDKIFCSDICRLKYLK